MGLAEEIPDRIACTHQGPARQKAAGDLVLKNGNLIGPSVASKELITGKQSADHYETRIFTAYSGLPKERNSYVAPQFSGPLL